MFTIEFFDYILSETRQRRVRIEAETVDDATAIVEELWEDRHKIMTLTDSDLVITRLSRYTDDIKKLLEKTERDDASIRIVVLEPERDARICHADITLDMLDPARTRLVMIADNIVLISDKGAAVNRMIIDNEGQRHIVYGTAIICRIEEKDVTSLDDDEAEEYRARFQTPGQILTIDDYVFSSPRNST